MLTATGAAGQANATPDAVEASVVRLARRRRYAGANHTHLSELLSERDGIDIGRTTLRHILLDAECTNKPTEIGEPSPQDNAS